MSGWTVPLSSSPQAPSTPGSGRGSTSVFTKSSNGSTKHNFAPNPSTTPVGPPPSSVGSFTPADPPPSSVFGSSQLGSGKTLFKSRASAGANRGSRRSANPLPARNIDGKKLARFLDKSGDFDFGSSTQAPRKNTFGVPSSSPLAEQESDGEEDDCDDDVEAYEDYEENDDVEASEEEDAMDYDHSLDPGSFISSIANGSAKGKSVAFGSSIMDTTPRGIKRTRGGSGVPSTPHRDVNRSSKPKHESAIPSIAKSMTTQHGAAELEESDDFVVETEDILEQDLYSTEVLGEAHEQALNAALPNTSERLCNFWRSSSDHDMARIATKQDTLKGIGPGRSAAPVHKATYLAALLLQLHHPPPAKGKQALAIARPNRSSLNSRTSPQIQTPSNPTAIPKVLIDWMNNCHDPYGSFNIDVQRFHPNPTAHVNYWDILFSMTLRGKLADVIHLFKSSNFHHARTAREDRKDNNGYSGGQVKNIERVVNRAIKILDQCPTLQDDDWNITENAWIMFRKRVEQEINDLATFAEGRDRDMDPAESTFEASNFGLRSTTMGLSQSARKAESRVPWTIYQNLKAIYGVLLGETTEILAMAHDWVEATVGLTVWWTGDEDEDMAVGSVALTRRSLRQSRGARLVDVNPIVAYLRRLASAFESINDEDSDEKELSVNTLDSVEVGLASIFEGNVEGVMGLLRMWSLPVASAVAEIASAGGWYEPPTGADVINGLDQSDLMMMSGYEQPTQPLTRDAILTNYAEALSTRDTIQDTRRGVLREGWELSMSVLARLDDEGVAAKKVSELLDQLALDSDSRMDKILRTCEQFGIPAQACKRTEEYADHVLDTSDDYGTALIYYARAHRRKKVKDILDLLISYSLVQSTAFPALSALDSKLHSLIFTPEQSLNQLSQVDPKAADTLHTYLTGYASLRRFYDLRDEELNLKQGQKPRSRPIARKHAAATALVAVINSAADNIHGGLYDGNRGAVVQVDGLLALLGEAMIFVNQPKMLLPLTQCFALLKAIEDLQNVTSRVYAQCEEFFHSTIAACQGRVAPPSPRRVFKKTMSCMTSASSFSLVGSSMLQSRSSDVSSSRALVKSDKEEKRGWDWRTGFGEDAKGEDVLRMLRLGLAKDIAKHWMSEGA